MVVFGAALAGGILPAALAEVAFTQVVRTGIPAPGNGGLFLGFDPPSLRSGHVGFIGGTAEIYGVYNTVGGLRMVADSNTPVPGQGGTFGLSINSLTFDGTFSAFIGNNGTGRSGVYADRGMLHAVADRTTPVPGGAGNFIAAGSPAIRAGEVAFLGYGPDTLKGVYTTVGGLHRVVDTTTPLPEGGGTFWGFSSDWFDFDGEAVAFLGYSTASQLGVYSDAGGALHVVARVGTPVPGSGQTFWSFAGISADEGAVAFDYITSGGRDGIATNAGGTLRIVANDAMTAPDTEYLFGEFGNLSLDAGNVAFKGTWRYPGDGYGLYARYNGSLIKILDVNDELGGKPVAHFNISNESFDGKQLAFQVEFEDGTEAIYVATIPEPGGILLLGLGAAGLLTRQRHRR